MRRPRLAGCGATRPARERQTRWGGPNGRREAQVGDGKEEEGREEGLGCDPARKRKEKRGKMKKEERRKGKEIPRRIPGNFQTSGNKTRRTIRGKMQFDD